MCGNDWVIHSCGHKKKPKTTIKCSCNDKGITEHVDRECEDCDPRTAEHEVKLDGDDNMSNDRSRTRKELENLGDTGEC
jgi:hypothetical protein